MQEWFREHIPGPFWETLSENVARMLSAARALSVPVVHVITRYSRDRSDWPAAWRHLDPIWCLEGTEGVEILHKAKPIAGEPVVVKTRFSGFYETELDRVLVGLDVDTLFVAGYSSDVCVRMTAMDAYNRGYRLYLLQDCVRAEREDTAASIAYLESLTNAQTVSTPEAVEILRGSSRAPSAEGSRGLM